MLQYPLFRPRARVTAGDWPPPSVLHHFLVLAATIAPLLTSPAVSSLKAVQILCETTD